MNTPPTGTGNRYCTGNVCARVVMGGTSKHVTTFSTSVPLWQNVLI